MLFSCQNNGDYRAQELATLTSMVNEVSEALNNLGFDIHPEQIGIEIKEERELIALFDAINDQAGPEIEDSKISHGVKDRLAFYDPNTKNIIFKAGAYKRMSKGYLAHELSHAYQDQKWGFDKIWEKYKKKPSREIYNIINYLVEGHAELARQAYEQAQATDKRTSLQLAISLGKIAENDCVICSPKENAANLPYSLGLRFLVKEYLKGGWPQVESHFEKLPQSSEQILHPDDDLKIKQVQIDLPKWSDKYIPADLVHEGPMGEAYLLAKLLSLNIAKPEAFLTSSGWHTDTAQLYRSKDKQEALIWRIAFDRELDAQQLEDVLIRAHVGDQIKRKNRNIDWIITSNASMKNSLRNFMDKYQNYLKPNSAQETSTHNSELRVKNDAAGFFGPYRATRIHIGPHP